MPRTTVNIDASVLEELKRLQRKEDKALGDMISELLSEALARRRSNTERPRPFEWHSRQMQARVDLLDKAALWKVLDEPHAESQ